MVGEIANIQFLGSGSAFSLDNFQSNLIITVNDKHLLVDCGTDIRHSLKEHDYSIADINDIYISHLHSDHIGGLECIGLIKKFSNNSKTPNLYISELLEADLWNRSLSGGMRTLNEKNAEISDFFKVVSVDKKNEFQWQNINFLLTDSPHVNNGDEPMPCFGLFFEIFNTKIYFTSDIKYVPEKISNYLDEADIIFHDCETSKIKTTVHAHLTDLIKLSPNIQKKMWLYHYNSVNTPSLDGTYFQGFVKQGQNFTISNDGSINTS